ncbi:hypothetical protein [Gloeocapsa sp. PCC 7428]|uniref:hypothetical protein n=1 Tax=Gloeocapsa sp. PCC 7428 TaxID=1173026 RepID=UPI0018C8C485|nr:hypothetical protein [Gloeocapsa sp. PCC 7428]
MKVCGVGTGDRPLAVCFLKKLSFRVWLWLLASLSGCIANSLVVLLLRRKQ